MFTFLPNTLILQNTICNQDYNNNNNPLSKRIKQKGKQKIASEEKFIYIYIYVCSMMEMISLKKPWKRRALFNASGGAQSVEGRGDLLLRDLFSRRWQLEKALFRKGISGILSREIDEVASATRHRFSWKYLRNDAARLIPENRTSVCRVEFEVEKCPRKNAFEWKYSGIHRSIYWIRRVRKEEKIKDSGNKTSLWLIIYFVYIDYVIVVTNSPGKGTILKW